MLAIIIFWNAGDKHYQSKNPEMLATNVSNYLFQKYWREMLAVVTFRNADDRYLATMILRNTTISFRNAGDRC